MLTFNFLARPQFPCKKELSSLGVTLPLTSLELECVLFVLLMMKPNAMNLHVCWWALRKNWWLINLYFSAYAMTLITYHVHLVS